MKPIITLSTLILFISTDSPAGYPEFPFCPSGGPQGWVNYFDYKRQQNNWQQYQQSPQPYYPAYSYRPYNQAYQPAYKQQANKPTSQLHYSPYSY